MRKHIGGQAHPPQHQENPKRGCGYGKCQRSHQGAAHEAKFDEGGKKRLNHGGGCAAD
jgi:hypothetical protein